MGKRLSGAPAAEQLRSVPWQGGEIRYTLRHKQVKNLNLRVRPDGSVWVSVPERCPASQADQFVASKAPFIRRAQEAFRQTEPAAPPAYESGESLTLLGETVQLLVSTGPRRAERIGDTLLLTLPDPRDSMARARLAETYLSSLCRETFSQILAEQYTAVARDCAVAMPQLRVRKMRSRWGSCLPGKGIVTLSRQLIFQPRPCVEYVILHELCHLIVPDHSPAFYAAVERWMPDWRERRARLRGRR